MTTPVQLNDSQIINKQSTAISIGLQGVFTIKIGHSGGFVIIGQSGPTVQGRERKGKERNALR